MSVWQRTLLTLLVISVFDIVIYKEVSALTFEFNKDKPGIQDIALQYLPFTVEFEKESIITKLPTTFYVLTNAADDLPVLAAQVGRIDKASGLVPYLDVIVGGRNAGRITGPHGEKIIYNPDRPSDWKKLSSYALWDGWIFLGNKKDTLFNLLKQYKNPSDIVIADTSITSIKGWKNAGMKVWGDNTDNHLYNLFEEEKKKIAIPLIKDTEKIKYIGGAFSFTELKGMNGSLIVRPMSQDAGKEIEGDLKFIGETIRRKLAMVKTPYKGKVYRVDNDVVYEAVIGNYMTAHDQIVQPEK